MQKKSPNNIGIIGCGWLGFPLAKTLAECGFTINGSTTSSEKIKTIEENGIVPFLLQLDSQKPASAIGDFLNVDLLIINIPPGRSANSADFYVDKLEYLKSEVLKSTVKKIIFISSTSVYAENNNRQTEESKDFGDSAIALRMLSAEKVFTQLPNIQTTIIRMAGLIGPERHPGRFFAGKKDIPNGLVPVNLIHLDDCIGIIHKIILEDLWNEVFNGVAPTHPLKMEFYDLASQQLYGKGADFIAEKGAFKIIEAEKIISKGYQFKHPDLLDWLQENPQN